MQSLACAKNIFVKAGFVVRIGSLDPQLREPLEINLDQDETYL